MAELKKIKKTKLPPSSIVSQANGLVTARYSLPLAEQRLILTMIARIQPNDEDFKPYRISVREMADFIGVSKTSAYSECKKITESLLKRVLTIDEPDGLLQVSWVSSAKYIDGAGMVRLSFDPSLKPYLLKLQGNFTRCKLDMLLSFKSQFTMRLYSILKQYAWRGKEHEIELETLREMLGINKDQYKLYADFRRYILDSTQKELAEKADHYFSYKEIKYGRRVGAILFQITKKDTTGPDTVLPPELPPLDDQIFTQQDQLLLLIPEQHRAKKTIQAALALFESKYGFDYVRRNIMYTNAKADKSYAAYINRALKEDWGHDWDLEQKDGVKKKKVVEIWERQGFESEKAYNEYMFNKQMTNYTAKEHHWMLTWRSICICGLD